MKNYKEIYNIIQDIDTKNYLSARHQKRTTRGIEYDGKKFICFNRNICGIGIEAISNKNQIVFAHTSSLESKKIIGLCKSLDFLLSKDISCMKIEGLFNFRINSKIRQVEHFSKNNDELNVNKYRSELKDINEYLQEIFESSSVKNCFLLGYDTWFLCNNRKGYTQYDHHYSSFTSYVTTNIKDTTFVFQVSISGKNKEIITQSQLIDKFILKSKRLKMIRQSKLDNNVMNIPTNTKVILDNESFDIIIHELIGHGSEGDFLFEKELNSEISKNLTISDTGNIDDWGYQPFDTHGNLRKKVDLIKNGNCENFLNGLYTNGIQDNGFFTDRIETYKDLPLPRITNISCNNKNQVEYFKEDSKNEIINLRDILYDNNYISKNEELLFLFGAKSGKFNRKTKICEIIPELICVLRDNEITIFPQKKIYLNSKNLLSSCLVSIGMSNNKSHYVCKKKNQSLKVGAINHNYSLFNKLELISKNGG
ncbi:Predicted Zn-dependent protease or its inactivated homolog [Clostridium collagenovorans DSM 3089]|uniref:Predicted Zn-dependent protease or its inactivated homolog n=1 Tax=Clostridium collagenovorans DSM 3089 TaxID=1121306 RepID=A0A1M5X5T4_9CLOT|nr:metallopeptidase TldD-related protein [Clostridium collagenovorans]SHH95200.1 Predicted Zn-dependent protease or its inactivated homolog [Clostridium collagenovorans DSM 3089]